MRCAATSAVECPLRPRLFWKGGADGGGMVLACSEAEVSDVLVGVLGWPTLPSEFGDAATLAVCGDECRRVSATSPTVLEEIGRAHV